MIGVLIGDMFIDFTNTEILCPDCKKDYRDKAEQVTNRINKNKSWVTKLNCECGTRFSITVDMQGDFQTFK